jgi:hypothetical protein
MVRSARPCLVPTINDRKGFLAGFGGQNARPCSSAREERRYRGLSETQRAIFPGRPAHEALSAQRTSLRPGTGALRSVAAVPRWVHLWLRNFIVVHRGSGHVIFGCNPVTFLPLSGHSLSPCEELYCVVCPLALLLYRKEKPPGQPAAIRRMLRRRFNGLVRQARKPAAVQGRK